MGFYCNPAINHVCACLCKCTGWVSAAVSCTAIQHRELAQQPSKLNEFIAFKLHVKEVWQCKEEVAVLKPGQVAAMYSTAAEWSSSPLPHADQVGSQQQCRAAHPP